MVKRSRRIMGFSVKLLIILLDISVSASVVQSVNVTCTPQTICALRESKVELMCSYSHINTTTVFWFSPKQKAKWRNEEHPEDLALDSDYAGRVSYTETTRSSSTLTITDLRERDSGEYHLMLFTNTGEKYHSSTAVNLTVTDLQVRVAPAYGLQKGLTCSTSCTLTSIPERYYWYKNGQYTNKFTEGNRVHYLFSSDEGSYSCSVYGFNDILSPPMCVFSKTCWSVTYTDRRVCFVEGSSVELPCTYSYPSNEKVEHTFWYYVRPNEDPQDLSQEEQFTGRVEYVGDEEKNCTLRIRELRKSDSGEYRFRFSGKTRRAVFSGKPGVIVNITDLQVRVSLTPVSEGQTVTLSCSSTCTLPYNPTYIWYKNGQPVTNKPTKHNKLYLQCSENSDNYSCAVRGHEEHRSPAETIHAKCPEGRTVLKHVTVGVAICLALILLTGALWMWRRNSRSAEDHKRFEKKAECDFAPVYDNVSALPKTSDPSQNTSDVHDGIHYSSVHFKHFHTQASQLPPSWPDFNASEEHSVHYAAVNFSRHAAATQ
ncbi:uncharacterized protein LOC113581481 [Electrophorus electricus]|uniref:uncharacterized protein LOC113581481 n=1 Tax=Electrophorus electricus TaxID=8005 RepID=UPI0015CFC96C|nr:uncharacterized protein LOC113581481 [Electrophorus electricus]